MTEVERIYKEEWLPRDFWKEETRCDYFISEKMKKVWAVELDLYREFARVCDENGLSYFTDGGTTLGAVRHEGFIPWDDDFDVCMPRESYEKLKELAHEFKAPYFLQSPHTDAEFGYSFLRLRNENTTVVVEPFNYCKFNQGIYIDIFPLDKVTREDYIPRREKIYELIMKNSAYMRYDYPHKTERDIELIKRYYNESITPKMVFDEIERIAMQDQMSETEYVSLLVSTQYGAEKKIWPKHIFDDYVEKDFESIKVRIPKGYHEQLGIYFGDYMQYPSVEQRGTWHSIQYEPEMPYREFYREHYKVKFE